jgi:hypothetical protein
MFATNSTHAGEGTFIEDVFSTYLYTGNGSTQTITNGIDLSTKGGLVWVKRRDNTPQHVLADTVQGAGNYLSSNSTAATTTNSFGVTSFASNGFGMSSGDGQVNANNGTYASWTFRKQPKFFDVVTYTGTGGGPSSVSHSLGSVPGFVIIKSTSRTGNWVVAARQSDGTYATFTDSGSGLQSTAAAYSTTATPVSAGALTATTFNPSWFNNSNTPGAVQNICDNGVTYVVYLFAHNAGGFGLTNTDNVISCGSFTTNASNGVTGEITLGYEPQWVMMKCSSTTSNWIMVDNMRGFAQTLIEELDANSSGAAVSVSGNSIYPTATGFGVSNGTLNSSQTWVYIAIRRGPMKVPTSGTSVFSPVAYTGTGVAQTITGNFPIDLIIHKSRTVSYAGHFADRLRGISRKLVPSSTQADSSDSNGFTNLTQSGFSLGTDVEYNENGTTYIAECFARSPGFFDIVCYTGTGSTGQVISHNLGVVPELVIFKSRSVASSFWWTYCSYMSNPLNTQVTLNTTNAANTSVGNQFLSAISSSAITTGTNAGFGINNSGGTYVAYLFATVAGVSKVGSYTGTGALQTINCGFTGGARFVLIKRTDSTGDWYVWDTARGIIAGNDPYLLLNSTAAEITSTDYIDPVASGFELSSTAPAAINANGGTFIFLAIA